MQVILVRHTRVALQKGICYGQTDVPVADTFEEEAAKTKALLQAYAPFDKVYSSPLSRARLLASYCGYPDHETDPRLMEMDMGQWEMRPYDELTDEYARQWFDDYLHLPTPGGESFQDQRARVEDFLQELSRQPYSKVAIFAHAGVLGCAAIYGGLYTETTAWDHLTDYGGLIEIAL
jgi:alpha-ribazole phosphatase